MKNQIRRIDWLLLMKKPFYENADLLDELKANQQPGQQELNALLSIIENDEELTIYFYGDDKESLPHKNWIVPLREAGQFQDLLFAHGNLTRSQRYKAAFLAEIASEMPDDVLDILSRVSTSDYFMQHRAVEALAKILDSSPQRAIQGMWVIWRYFGSRERFNWFMNEQQVAEFMVKLVDYDPNQAFAIASLLVEIWVPKTEKKASFREVTARFDAHEYCEMMFKYCKQLWDKHPLRTTEVLIQALNKCIEALSKEKQLDASEEFYFSIENLDSIDRSDRDLVASLTEGICCASRAVIEKQPGSIKALFDILGLLDKQLFLRIEMYLLRFVPAGTKTDRISKLIADKDLFDGIGCEHEYILLLRDRAGDITQKSRDAFISYVQQIKISNLEAYEKWFEKTRNRKFAVKDRDEYENRLRASKLYQVREVFPDLYEKCKEAGQATDVQLMPRPRSMCTSAPGPIEESPITVEQMLAMAPTEVLGYLLNKDNFKEPNTVGHTPWYTQEETIFAVFREVLNQRANEFIRLDFDSLDRLKPGRLGIFFRYIWETVNREAGSIGSKFWPPFLLLAKQAVHKHGSDPAYRECLSVIQDMIRIGLKGGQAEFEKDEANISDIWSLLERLLAYKDLKEQDPTERDPIQRRCTSIPGESLELLVWLARKCKHSKEDYYNDVLCKRVKAVLDRSIADFKGKSEILCTLGIEFSGLFWLNENWLKENINTLFSAENWDTIWGTYVSWGRPWRKAFEYLVHEQVYQKAITRLDQEGTSDSGKSPAKGLAEHLVIAYFNGWLESIDDNVWNMFFENASDELRAYATSFMATGFKSTKEDPKPDYLNRIRSHWHNRLGVFLSDKDAFQKESQELATWVVDCPLPPNEALDLISRTLAYTQGVLGSNKDVYQFVNSIADMAKGNELTVVSCIRMIIVNEFAEQGHSLYKDKLTSLLEYITTIQNPSAKLTRETLGLIDDLGRLHIYIYRKFYEQLNANAI